MRKFAILGNPVEHSLSPLMQNAAFSFYKLDYEYKKILIESETALGVFLKGTRKEYSGFNVTLPYKASVIKYLDSLKSEARIASSVNVISIDDSGKLCGDSTDGYGFAMALKRNFKISIKEEKYLFLGCGGAARACIVHLIGCGAREIVIANRTKSKADEVTGELLKHFPSATIKSCFLSDSETIRNLLSQNYIVIQSTSLGLKEQDELPLDGKLLSPGIRIFDMIYKETKLQKLAREKKCECFGGLDMLLYQGARAFEIWTNLEAPVEIMRRALIDAFPVFDCACLWRLLDKS